MATDAENVPHLLEDKHSPFTQYFCNLYCKSLLVSEGNSLFGVVFKVFQASEFVAVDCFFKKSSEKGVGWYKVWGLWLPKSMPDNAVTEDALQESFCCFHCVGIFPILQKPAILLIFLQQSSELGQEI